MKPLQVIGGGAAIIGALGVFLADVWSLYYIGEVYGFGWAALAFLFPPAWAIAPFISGIWPVFLASLAILWAGMMTAEQGTKYKATDGLEIRRERP